MPGSSPWRITGNTRAQDTSVVSSVGTLSAKTYPRRLAVNDDGILTQLAILGAAQPILYLKRYRVHMEQQFVKMAK